MQKIKFLLDYFKYLKNPIEALKFKFNLKDSYKIKIKNTNESITLYKVSSLDHIMRNIHRLQKDKTSEFFRYIKDIEEDKKIVTVRNIKYINVLNSSFKEKSSLNYALCIEEYFWGDEWNMINFNGRHVIDIGGNNGDTSLYFAQEGAEVIGFEPVKHLFDLALENIELNKGLKDKITYINKGVGGKKGKLKINADSVKDYIDDGNYDMEITTLTEILNTYNFKPDVLKIDCEGCEFEIVEKEDLSMV